MLNPGPGSYVVIDGESYLVAMEQLREAFAICAQPDACIAGIAGSIGIALGCLGDAEPGSWPSIPGTVGRAD